ncbi:MAG: ABC transporter permease [Rhodocyclaceae bacterium]|nr:MAG: ABC transporter permease [Rhodocyclaceae bacterium]
MVPMHRIPIFGMRGIGLKLSRTEYEVAVMSTLQSIEKPLSLESVEARLPPLHLPGQENILPALRRLAIGMVFPLLLLALWKVATVHVWLPPQLLPDPAFVWESLKEMAASGELLGQALVSLKRVLWSMLLGGGSGLALGFAMGLSPRAKAYLYPSFSLLSQFPVIGWSPLMIIFFGIDEALKIATITVAVIVPFAVATYKGIQNVPVKLMEVGRIYGFSFRQTLWHIALPAALPAILGGVRQGGMQAWLALVFVELLASSEGLGYLLVYSRNLMQLDVVMVCMAAIGLIGLLFDLALTRLEQHFSRLSPKGY